MSLRAKLKRLVLLVDKIHRTANISKKELLDYMSNNDFDVSERTIERDLQMLRDEFDFRIVYDASINGYRIDTSDGVRFEKLLRLLAESARNTFLIEHFQDHRGALDAVSFESSRTMKGYQFFSPLLDSILTRKLVSFTYTNFRNGVSRGVLIKPLHLKEYLNRWYLIGLSSTKGKEALLTFGLDRMEELSVTEEQFDIPEQNAAALYDNLIGLSGSGNESEKVILRFSAFQGNYVKSFPLHTSQVIFADDPENGLTILLDVVINVELQRIILSYGDEVIVEQPATLRSEIKKILKKSLTKY